jgi:hypothetical protein
MSKDALAGVYSKMLTDEGFRSTVAEHPDVLATWDLTAEERDLLVEDAETEVASFAIGAGGVMGYLSSGPRLSPSAASGLGTALNQASGLPTGSLQGPGFASGAGCCPWGHAVVSPGLEFE